MKRIAGYVLLALTVLSIGTAGVGAAPGSPPPFPWPPTDPGRLSLLQVSDDQLLNMRNLTPPGYGSIGFVDGRTRWRRATSIYAPGYIRVPVEGNFTLDRGTVAFWVLKEDWASTSDNWFFRVDIDGPYPFIDNFQVRKWGDGQLYWGFELHRGVYPVYDLEPTAWHLIVVTWEFGGGMRLFLDGELKQEITLPNAEVVTTKPYINWGEWGGLPCQCAEEDMQTFDYALEPSQVAEVYASRFPAKFYRRWWP